MIEIIQLFSTIKVTTKFDFYSHIFRRNIKIKTKYIRRLHSLESDLPWVHYDVRPTFASMAAYGWEDFSLAF